MTIISQAFNRYPEAYSVLTDLDPLSDIAVLVESFTSTEYLVETISRSHSLPTDQAVRRARRAVPHIRTALQYVDQAASGPRDVAFLPIYYAMLNLAKVYILLGPRHVDLTANRWHGAQYRGYEKDSQTLMTEEIVLKKGGTIPIFYETLTGEPFPGQTRIRMSEIYPFVLDVSGEFVLATSRASVRLASVRFEQSEAKNGWYTPLVYVWPRSLAANKRAIKLLRGFRRIPASEGYFAGPRSRRPFSNFESLRHHFRPYLLYRVGQDYRTPVCGHRLLLPEELPILLLFFHLSSVVRYKPEFFARLRDSRFWPVVNAAGRHCLLKFLTLFWSFVHQKSLRILPASAQNSA